MESSVIALILFTNCVSILGVRILVQESPGMNLGANYLEHLARYANFPRTIRQLGHIANDNVGKQRLCSNSVEAVRFWLEPPNSVAEPQIIQNYLQRLTQEINLFYADISYPKFIGLEILFAQGDHFVPQQILGVPCTRYENNSQVELAVVNGYNDRHFYIMGQVNGNSELIGLVEELPTRNDENTNNNQQALEEAFKRSQKLYDQKPHDKRRSIHKLNNFNKLRACASVYMVWPANTANINVRNFIREPNNTSIKAKTQIESSIGFDFSFPPRKNMDIIACAVNTAAESPQFYLTADQLTVGAAYVLMRQTEGKFRVQMKVTGVLGMENLY